jgi:hypothetical protein
MEEQGDGCGEPAEQDGGKDYPEQATPEERVQRMRASASALVDQGSAVEPLSAQQAEGRPSFLASHEIGG